MEELEGFKRAILLNMSPMEGAQAGPVLGTGTEWRSDSQGQSPVGGEGEVGCDGGCLAMRQ